ncbi:integumentary mucin C.1-like [Carassius carassius]|uniref:integumentary mucin C.1-like n=1 Tax=Carassius carassius TaxID=217509 RepID=UPI00286949D5|nr:integumentary mucin C.1-like [Carassius carassius]
MTCSPAYEILIGDFCIVNVQQNTSVLGDCNSYHFNITNDGGKYKVRMNDTVKNITMWFLPNGSRCLPSEVLNSSGFTSNNPVTCQTQPSSSTTTQSITTIANNPSSCPNKPINTSCIAIYPDACCLKIAPVDPEITCRNASYGNDTCTGNEKSRYILYLNGSEWMCVTCVDERSTTPAPTTSSTSYTTTNSPTTSSTSYTTTNSPTTSSTSYTTTNSPTTSSTSYTTTNSPTTSSTSYTTTPSNY